MEWKNDVLAKIDARLEHPPISYSEYTNLENDEYRQMQLEGIYLFDKEIKLMNKTYNGKPGFHVMTPLELFNGERVIINRGWIPVEKEYEQPAGVQTVTGVIRRGQAPNWLTLENNPQKGHWFWIDLPTIYSEANAEPLEYYIDRKLDTDSATYPLALPKKIQLYNEHLQYAITWFSLSIALLVIYYFRFFRKIEKK